jgi:hypothetical protein
MCEEMGYSENKSPFKDYLNFLANKPFQAFNLKPDEDGIVLVSIKNP